MRNPPPPIVSLFSLFSLLEFVEITRQLVLFLVMHPFLRKILFARLIGHAYLHVCGFVDFVRDLAFIIPKVIPFNG